MGTTVGRGFAPNAPALGIVQGLAFERFAQTGEAEKARLIAPLVDLGIDEGSYVYEPAQFVGYDLTKDANMGDEVSLETESYSNVEMQLADRTFRVKRWQGGMFQLPDRQAAKLQRGNGIDVERWFANRVTDKLNATFARQVISAATTSGNYDSDNTYDPGNLTTTSFDLLGALTTLDAKLTDKGISDTAELLCVGGPTEVNTLLKLTQVQAYGSGAGAAPNTNLFTEQGRLEQILSEMAGRPIRVVKSKLRQKAANGTSSYVATSGVLSFVVAAGGMDTSLLKTVHGGEQSLFSFENEHVAGFRGWRMYADGYWDVHVADAAAGVCWTGILS